jgi:predicted ester cyclase
MSTEENKAVIRKIFSEFNKWNLGPMNDCLAQNFVRHSVGMPDMDREGYKQLLVGMGPAQCTIDDMVAEGDRVAFRNSYRFTHTTPLFGVPPTGKQITMTEYYFSRFQGGKVAEWWCLFDMAGLMQQLGMVPPAG